MNTVGKALDFGTKLVVMAKLPQPSFIGVISDHTVMRNVCSDSQEKVPERKLGQTQSEMSFSDNPSNLNTPSKKPNRFGGLNPGEPNSEESMKLKPDQNFLNNQKELVSNNPHFTGKNLKNNPFQSSFEAELDSKPNQLSKRHFLTKPNKLDPRGAEFLDESLNENAQSMTGSKASKNDFAFKSKEDQPDKINSDNTFFKLKKEFESMGADQTSSYQSQGEPKRVKDEENRNETQNLDCKYQIMNNHLSTADKTYSKQSPFGKEFQERQIWQAGEVFTQEERASEFKILSRYASNDRLPTASHVEEIKTPPKYPPYNNTLEPNTSLSHSRQNRASDFKRAFDQMQTLGKTSHIDKSEYYNPDLGEEQGITLNEYLYQKPVKRPHEAFESNYHSIPHSRNHINNGQDSTLAHLKPSHAFPSLVSPVRDPFVSSILNKVQTQSISQNRPFDQSQLSQLNQKSPHKYGQKYQPKRSPQKELRLRDNSSNKRSRPGQNHTLQRTGPGFSSTQNLGISQGWASNPLSSRFLGQNYSSNINPGKPTKLPSKAAGNPYSFHSVHSENRPKRLTVDIDSLAQQTISELDY